MEPGTDRARVLLSVQRALLGAVGPSLRGVACDWDASEVRIRSYFDGPISDADREAMAVAETEVMADFPDRDVDLECVRYDAPQALPEKSLRAWACVRRE